MELIGKRFGRWLVIDTANPASSGEPRQLCRCDCGTQRPVLQRSLIYGASKSCGCLARENARRAVSRDLRGQTFGDLTVLGEAQKPHKTGGRWWLCQCVCGNTCDVSATLLATGKKTHCGCKSAPKSRPYVDITGQTFRRLTALYPTSRRTAKGAVIWHCRCACGNEVDVSYNALRYSPQQSCGCQKKAHDQALGEHLTRIDGTSIDLLRSKKLPADNSTGVKGVYFIRGKYVAKIVFQKKQYHLGSFQTLAEAARVRREAEELLFEGSVRHYERWKAIADARPDWAEQHPVEIIVQKREDHGLDVTFLPAI